jgi:hypothetical protein
MISILSYNLVEFMAYYVRSSVLRVFALMIESTKKSIS